MSKLQVTILRSHQIVENIFNIFKILKIIHSLHYSVK